MQSGRLEGGKGNGHMHGQATEVDGNEWKEEREEEKENEDRFHLLSLSV